MYHVILRKEKNTLCDNNMEEFNHVHQNQS